MPAGEQERLVEVPAGLVQSGFAPVVCASRESWVVRECGLGKEMPKESEAGDRLLAVQSLEESLSQR